MLNYLREIASNPYCASSGTKLWKLRNFAISHTSPELCI